MGNWELVIGNWELVNKSRRLETAATQTMSASAD